MSQNDGQKSSHYAQSPAVAALKYDAGVGPEPHKVMMERSFSQDIQEGTQELKQAAEQTRNMILDLGLDGVIRWVSPSWTDVVGTDLLAIKGTPIKQYIDDDPEVFERAIKTLESKNSKSVFVRFTITLQPSSELQPMLDIASSTKRLNSPSVDVPASTADHEEARQQLLLDGQGIMVYDRTDGKASHTMWMLQPAAEPVHIEIELPKILIDLLGVGAEVLAKYLSELAEGTTQESSTSGTSAPLVCRVCERSIVPWWFERHSDLCVQEHKAELDVQMIQENLVDHRHQIVKILDAFEARQGRTLADLHHSVIEYKGKPIKLTPGSSQLSSNAASPNRSRSPSVGLNHSRTRSSFIPRRSHIRVVELILDLCDTAIDISTPSLKDDIKDGEGFSAVSPLSDSKIGQVIAWTNPLSLEPDSGLSILSSDTERLARAKVEAVHRHRVILEYGETIRQEYMAEVDACIAEALVKADRARAGDLTSSSESESELDLELEEQQTDPATGVDEATTLAAVAPVGGTESQKVPPRPTLRSLASALRNPYDISMVDVGPSSQAASTGSSSPQECPTPRSTRSTLVQPQPVHKRRSFYGTDDAEQSDGSLPLTSTASSTASYTRRTESPVPIAEASLSRSASTRDRRNRRSMHLHGLNSASPHRGSSPGRYAQTPASPLRMNKARMSSISMDIGAATSPVVSPILTSGEFVPSPHYHSHRRQSSVHSSDLRPPLSPRLLAHQPQPKPQPPSIRDYEIVKPISRGAFGSVYLSKKKITGEYFAIKVLRKSDMIAKNQVTNVKAERAIMMWQGESDFVAKLYWTFSSKDYLFLVMEYLNGGDCASLVKILGGLTEDWTKKYIAEVVLGVEYLHGRGIVHRDLKPDNLLIDSKGHLKLTDFGLSRMGLVGRQKRALKSPEILDPDFIKQGQLASQIADPSSRHASFDYQEGSPVQTPLLTPALVPLMDQPSYFSLNRENSTSRDWSRRASGFRVESGGNSIHDLYQAFSALGVNDGAESGSRPSSLYFKPRQAIEEESQSRGSASPDLFPLSQSISNVSQAPNAYSMQMLPPPTALFDPDDVGNRKFVGTPDYLAPETITGTVQDEMCDWWSLGCILFEFLFGIPPFNADTTELVFDNILHRRIAWPDEEILAEVSSEAKDLINKLIQLDPKERLGANREDKYKNGGGEIQAHPWFSDINWQTLLEDEAQFVPNPENPEDTEYFDPRGAVLQTFPEELEDQISPAGGPGSRPEDRPHDAIFKTKVQSGPMKRTLMPLHIPAHVTRDSRSRRSSEPGAPDDFGNFAYRNLPALEKANKDIVERMRRETMTAQVKSNQQAFLPTSNINTPVIPSPVPSVDSSPIPMTVQRALSVNKHHRTASPSGLSNMNPPPRPSQPGSPMLVQFSTASHHHHHERRKTSGSSTASSLQAQLSPEAEQQTGDVPTTSLYGKRMSIASPSKPLTLSIQPVTTGRNRSHTVGSQDGGSPLKEPFIPTHHKRKSALFNTREPSPSSSDNESLSGAKAQLRVHRRRQSSRRMSQFVNTDTPAYRPLDILICEDHPVTQMVMERLFEKMRCRTITAKTGAQALTYAMGSIPFDIVFMEYRLPELSGIDVARMIRDTKSINSSTPIVCVTGYLKDLPEVHKFDSLMQKPPTIEKLTEALCKYCAWKPPPKDLRALPLGIIPAQSAQQQMNSPSSVASSKAPTLPESSYWGSSRGDSIGSGFLSDLESSKGDSIPMIISSRATEDWTNSGLGISDEPGIPQKSTIPRLTQTESAPAELLTDNFFGPAVPHHLLPQEHVRTKRESMEKDQSTASGAEEGDDEDEEFGRHQSRQRSPRTGSKLGHEMLRTNSRGSVVSIEPQYAEPDSLRQTLEMVAERIQGLRIPEEGSDLERTQSRKGIESISPHTLAEPFPAIAHGQITPPIMFPMEPGHLVRNMKIERDEIDPDPTPMPNKTLPLSFPLFDETTPKATSENGSSATPKPRSVYNMRDDEDAHMPTSVQSSEDHEDLSSTYSRQQPVESAHPQPQRHSIYTQVTTETIDHLRE